MMGYRARMSTSSSSGQWRGVPGGFAGTAETEEGIIFALPLVVTRISRLNVYLDHFAAGWEGLFTSVRIVSIKETQQILDFFRKPKDVNPTDRLYCDFCEVRVIFISLHH